MYALNGSDLFTYNNTLLVYPDPLGVSVNVTCIAMYKGVNYIDITRYMKFNCSS